MELPQRPCGEDGGLGSCPTSPSILPLLTLSFRTQSGSHNSWLKNAACFPLITFASPFLLELTDLPETISPKAESPELWTPAGPGELPPSSHAPSFC